MLFCVYVYFRSHKWLCAFFLWFSSSTPWILTLHVYFWAWTHPMLIIHLPQDQYVGCPYSLPQPTTMSTVGYVPLSACMEIPWEYTSWSGSQRQSYSHSSFQWYLLESQKKDKKFFTREIGEETNKEIMWKHAMEYQCPSDNGAVATSVPCSSRIRSPVQRATLMGTWPSAERHKQPDTPRLPPLLRVYHWGTYQRAEGRILWHNGVAPTHRE